MFEFTNVPRPGILRHHLQCGAIECPDFAAIPGGIAPQKMYGERRDIFTALAQRRHMNLDRVEAKQEVFAELARSACCLKIAIGGGDQADIDLSRSRGSQPLDLTRFEHAQQFCLLPEGYIADLVQKIVPPSASSKRPMRSVRASVNAPFTWPKSSLSNKSFRQRTRIYCNY